MGSDDRRGGVSMLNAVLSNAGAARSEDVVVLSESSGTRPPRREAF